MGTKKVEVKVGSCIKIQHQGTDEFYPYQIQDLISNAEKSQDSAVLVNGSEIEVSILKKALADYHAQDCEAWCPIHKWAPTDIYLGCLLCRPGSEILDSLWDRRWKVYGSLYTIVGLFGLFCVFLLGHSLSIAMACLVLSQIVSFVAIYHLGGIKYIRLLARMASQLYL